MTPYYAQCQAESYARLKRNPLAYGGRLRNTRYGRSRARPLSQRHSMHLVLRATQNTMREPRNFQRIQALVQRFTAKYRITIIRFANVRNHLHLHVKLNRVTNYRAFIRGLTAAIAMAVTGASRWRKLKERFWLHRPFTRLVTTVAGYHRLNRYIDINELEGRGYHRFNAEMLVIEQEELIALGFG